MRVAWSWLQKLKLRSEAVLITGNRPPVAFYLNSGKSRHIVRKPSHTFQVNS